MGRSAKAMFQLHAPVNRNMFEQRVTESLSDYKTHYSDWRISDFRLQKPNSYNPYLVNFLMDSDQYLSGFETTAEMPRA